MNRQYLTKARKLDAECFPSEPDVEARPILRKLRSYPRVRGQCVGAFAECSSDIHLLLREAARCAAIRYWRQVGAVSVEAAVAIYSNRYRSHWGAELALQGARLRFSRAYLAAKAPTCQAGMTFGTSSSALTRPTAHNMQRKRHPSLQTRRVARIGTGLYAAAALCLFLCLFLCVFFCVFSVCLFGSRSSTFF